MMMVMRLMIIMNKKKTKKKRNICFVFRLAHNYNRIVLFFASMIQMIQINNILGGTHQPYNMYWHTQGYCTQLTVPQ